MPNKKKGEKKSASKATTSKPDTPPIAQEPPKKLDDVSPLLFDTHKNDELPFDLPFVGPVALVDQRHCDAGQHKAVVHGRGLIVTRDVSPGECLFVISAIVSTPVEEARRRFSELHSNESGSDQVDHGEYGKELEDIAENLLIEQLQSLCKDNDEDEEEFKQSTFNSFVSQMSSDDVPQADLDVVLAESSSKLDNQNTTLDKETILNTIRRNAFGPDYHNYNTIANWWIRNPTNESAYQRLLGVYPLAAMINHSCCPNAVRIFGNISSLNSSHEIRGREVMIVHASMAMKKGTEITWSYLPPTTTYNLRRDTLKTKYGFICQCIRCTREQTAMDVPLFHQTIDGNEISLPETIESLEMTLTSSTIPNETQRYIRVGYAPVYIQYFNMALTQNSDVSNLLHLATQLHFAFVSCNNASTEHLSILHLCYELVSILHRASSESTKTLNQVRFWTEQLKTAHMIRYGSLGGDLESVREIMKHTRMVLRNRDGWYLVKNRFI
jgi:hypothetical protein